jgi:hypothetical protein
MIVDIRDDSSLMMETVRTSETSVNNHFTRQYNLEDNSEHHTRRRENLKSHKVQNTFTTVNQATNIAYSLQVNIIDLLQESYKHVR